MTSLLGPLSRTPPNTNRARGLLGLPGTVPLTSTTDLSKRPRTNGFGGTGTKPKSQQPRLSLKVRAALFKSDQESDADFTLDISAGHVLIASSIMRPINVAAEQAARIRGDNNAFSYLGRPVLVSTWTVTNFLFADLTVKPPADIPDGPTPDWCLTYFKPVGVVTTSKGAAQYTVGSRVFAVDNENWNTLMVNYFGPMVWDADLAYILALMRPRSQHQSYQTLTAAPLRQKVEVKTVTGKVIRDHLQLLPYIGAFGYVPSRHLVSMVMEDDGIPRPVQGHGYRLGKILALNRREPVTPEISAIQSSEYHGNLNAMVNSGACVDAKYARDVYRLEQVEICVGPTI